ncbi:hypothetical protein OG883_37825 [Streptomyces sp. NBC_01142]|uniref:hypothetical protein n=1 Tax=Streptomyces sp. NBC_01142 TaxID=2975865 RepID=UPI00225BEEDA|nr:hypothetical protein [Streptomyces sp. NBC_01142]MCX4825516.1 hypothetical protein [Streptomyces sp. NBC_01142]
MRYIRWTSDRMFVSYCQYYLVGEDFLTVYDDTDTVSRIFDGNSLAAGGPEHLTVYAGTHTGWIRLTTEQRSDAPPPPGDAWETAVEVSIYSTSGVMRLERWGGDSVEEAGNFASAGPGWYRVRVQTRGRDEGDAHEGDESSEEHFLSVWPAPPEPDVVHRAADAFAGAHYDPARPPGRPIHPDDPVAFADHSEYGGTPTPLTAAPDIVVLPSDDDRRPDDAS